MGSNEIGAEAETSRKTEIEREAGEKERNVETGGGEEGRYDKTHRLHHSDCIRF